jgi:hypothetical protein
VKNTLFFLVVAVGLLACADNTVRTVDELRAYTLDKEHGLHIESEQKSVAIDVLYKPKDFVVFQEIEDRSFTTEQVDSVSQAFRHYDYFVLDLTRNGKEIVNSFADDPAMFQRAVNYFSYDVGKDIRLIVDHDTLPVADFIYARSYSIGKGASIQVGFKSELSAKSGKAHLQWLDMMCGSGLHNFEFNISDIKDTPKLLLN